MLTAVQVAEILEISIPTVRRLYRDGDLRYKRIGYRTVRIFESSVSEYQKRDKSLRIKDMPENEPFTIDISELPPAGV